MYPTMRDFQEQEFYRERRVRIAEHEATLRMITNHRSHSPLTYQRVFIRIGGWLEKTGRRIKSRYEVSEVEIASSSLSGRGYLGC